MKQLIGYQIVSKDGNEIPECFYRFEIITLDAAECWLQREYINPEFGEFRWVLLPIFEGDIENFTLIEYI